MNAMNDLAVLKTLVPPERDADGYRRMAEPAETTIYCKVNTASRAEVYEALRSGIKVSMSATVNADDYKTAIVVGAGGKKVKPSVLVHDGTDYTITRAYQKDDVLMELSLSEVE